MARLVIIKDHDCNRCDRKCGGDITRGKRGDIKSHLMCPGWHEPYAMRTSLLERASEHDSSFSALNVILSDLHLTYNETSRYPYFTFRPTD
jgi:hypothetical protein